MITRSQIPGTLVSRPVERGGVVQKGDLLCRLSEDDRPALLAEARDTLSVDDLAELAAMPPEEWQALEQGIPSSCLRERGQPVRGCLNTQAQGAGNGGRLPPGG